MQRAFLTSALFLAGAGLCCALAYRANIPTSAHSSFIDLGAPFSPAWTDPMAAASVEIRSFSPSGTLQILKTEFKDGRWFISTHNGYPADAKARVQALAAELMALKKDELRSELSADHAALGLIDPSASDKDSSLLGRGTRITLRNPSGEILTDLIFGSEVEGKPGYRYCRRATDNFAWAVHCSGINLDSSFSAWVETGLLNITAEEVQSITLKDYAVDGESLIPKQGYTLSHSDKGWSSSVPLPPGKAIKDEAIQSLLATLTDLRLADVQPKPASLVKALNDGTKLSQEDRQSLAEHGFYLIPEGLFSDDGELSIRLKNGLGYTLRFGKIDVESTSAITDATGQAASPRRQLFITCDFKEASLPAAPAVPPEPVKPEGKDEATVMAYMQQLQAYHQAKDAAEQHAASIEAAKTQLKAQVRRFADWFYVIDGDAFTRLKQPAEAFFGDPAPATTPDGALPVPNAPLNIPNLFPQ